ncbi:hypothetical protein [Thalassovita sp.]|uniref:hypothetical protein n=1 Tax=Thalassovita sp. TaxID=1979401 RepID=UPI002B273AD7|nr:hypothetical protein [Thalassovita sp.]
MRNVQNSMADRQWANLPALSDQWVVLSILTETGISDCFSLERFLDRLEHLRTPE